MRRSWGRRAVAGLALLAGLAGGPVPGTSALATASTAPDAASAPTFSAEERAQILSLGPWPPPPARDPGNPVATSPAAIALGERLFRDRRLSRDGTLACISCHVPALALADGQTQPLSRTPPQRLDRNAPTLWNTVHQRWQGWDGAADSLWSQALRVMHDPREFDQDAAGLQARIEGDASLQCHWREAFGGMGADPQRTQVQIAQAIAAYVGTLVSPPTAFDRWRDALAAGDAPARQAAEQAFGAAARRGLRLFLKHQCTACHGGPMFSHGEFADIGVPFFVRPGVVDPGRHGGIAALRASPFNLLGPWAHRGADWAEAALKTRHVTLEHRHFGEFKVPGLRLSAATAPYMHDGRLPTLEAVVDHYSNLPLDRLHADGEQILKPLRLQPQEAADLVAFLRSLGDTPPPVPPPPRSACEATPTEMAGQGAVVRSLDGRPVAAP